MLAELLAERAAPLNLPVMQQQMTLIIAIFDDGLYVPGKFSHLAFARLLEALPAGGSFIACFCTHGTELYFKSDNVFAEMNPKYTDELVEKISRI